MKEYGGYFELEKLDDSELYPEFLKFNYARTALRYLIRSKRITKIYLPYYICQSIIDAILAEHVEIEYYHIDIDLLPECEIQPLKHERLLFINYFSLLSNQEIRFVLDKYKYVILDNTQAFFSLPSNKIEAIYSCRKFFGVPDGGYLSGISPSEFLPFPRDKSGDRLNFLVGRLEDTASEHYAAYREQEELAGQQDIRFMSKFTQRILQAINYDRVQTCRYRNFEVLSKALSPYNLFSKMFPQSAPYGYPFYFKNSEKLRAILQKRNIYIPVLWKNVLDLKSATEFECSLAKDLLLLPVDQRYPIDDMEYLGKIVQENLTI